MNRREFLKAASGASLASYLWIPKIAIAQISGDPREAIIRARSVVAEHWNLVSSGLLAATSSDANAVSAIARASATMKEHEYVDISSPGTELLQNEGGLRLFGAFHRNGVDHCTHYFAMNELEPLAYISTVPFLMKSLTLEKAVKAVSVSKTISLLYPIEEVRVFDAYLNKIPTVPIRVLCAQAVWVCNYSVDGPSAGHGTFGIYSRDRHVKRQIFEQHFDYEFA